MGKWFVAGSNMSHNPVERVFGVYLYLFKWDKSTLKVYYFRLFSDLWGYRIIKKTHLFYPNLLIFFTFPFSPSKPADVQNKSLRQDGEQIQFCVAGPRVVQSAATRLKQPVSFKLCLRGTSELLNHNGLPRGPRFMVPEEGGMLIKF